MKRRHILQSVGGIAAASTLGIAVTGTAVADCDKITPNGPFPPETAAENYQGFLSNEQLYDRLHRLENRSNVEYEEIGETWEGRPIPYATIGSGDFHVFHTTQQHGDEQPGTEAALDVLQVLGNGRGNDDILDEVTIHVIPRHNPDGWAPAGDNETPTRSNARPESECHDNPYASWWQPTTQCGPVDPNRQHYFQFDDQTLAQVDPDAFDADVGIPDENPSPETQAMLDKVEEVGADLVVDWHTQFTYYDDDCDMINVSMAWPYNEAAPDEAVDLSKRGVAALRDGVQGRANGNVSRYPGGTTVNIARNAHGVAGRGSILIEQRGQASELNNASRGQLVRHAKFMFDNLHAELASGALFERSPDEVDDLQNFHNNSFWKDLPEEQQAEAEAWWEEERHSH
ncbi:M14 family zinc carboxypeptidase [Natronorarus salvus]|uniref:M14 family zinc carboxypeptidase n=1 Tax=Natronorarus salvus TaxID=3117733 RepID=UPI002F2626B9